MSGWRPSSRPAAPTSAARRSSAMADPSRPGRRLRLRAEDDEDLAVIAAVLQDAVVRVGDLAFLPSRRQFVGLFTRFCWVVVSPAEPDRFTCVRTVMYFHAVHRTSVG